MKTKEHKKNRLILIMICIWILLTIIGAAIAKYISSGLSEGKVDIAYYVFDAGIQSQNLTLDTIVPSSQPYKYKILVTNTLNEKKAETAIEYYLEIEATTNLPLSYNIYFESGNKDDRNTNQFEVYDVYTGDDGVYYKKMKTGIKQLGLEEQEDVYVLKIEFPEENKVNLEYADILEMLKITIESKQKI